MYQRLQQNEIKINCARFSFVKQSSEVRRLSFTSSLFVTSPAALPLFSFMQTKDYLNFSITPGSFPIFFPRTVRICPHIHARHLRSYQPGMRNCRLDCFMYQRLQQNEIKINCARFSFVKQSSEVRRLSFTSSLFVTSPAALPLFSFMQTKDYLNFSITPGSFPIFSPKTVRICPHIHARHLRSYQPGMRNCRLDCFMYQRLQQNEIKINCARFSFVKQSSDFS